MKASYRGKISESTSMRKDTADIDIPIRLVLVTEKSSHLSK